MSEDEVFIRAIIDNPGDDLPRLVYADWLDDRSDPRGTYLRAEREAVATGGTASLRELAADLDPVWVARVSTPPVGVCVDVTWNRRGETVSGADLERFEARFAIALPAQYRAFLLNHNGGVIALDPREAPDEVAYRDSCRFHSLARTSCDDPEFSLEYEYATRRDSIFKGTPREDGLRVGLRNAIIIGVTPGQHSWVLLGVGKQNTGGICTIATFSGFGHEARHPYVPQHFGSLAKYLLSLYEQRR